MATGAYAHPMSFDPKERRILEALDAAVRGHKVRPILDEIAARIEKQLLEDPHAPLTWEPVPLATYCTELPAGILSSWVFVLRSNSTSGAERHPNSHQRTMAWRGTGDLQIWEQGSWRSRELKTDPAAPLEERWVSIPVNVWHKPVMGPQTWVVVSFHTVLAEELIEERGDPKTEANLRRKTYL